MENNKIKICKEKMAMKHRGIRFPDNDWSALKEISKKENVSISDVVRHASKAFVEAYNQSL